MDRRTFLKLTGAAALAASLPARAAVETRFAVISDPHLDIGGGVKTSMKMSAESALGLELTVDALNREPDLAFVLVLGDLLLDGERANALAARERLDRLAAPYQVVLGNHDYAPTDDDKREGQDYLSPEQFIEIFEDHGYQGGGRVWRHQGAPGLGIYGTDGCLPGDWGGAMAQLRIGQLKKAMSENADDVRILAIHHNLVRWCDDEQKGGPHQGFALTNSAAVLKMLGAVGGPMIVLSGHRHIGLRHEQRGSVHCLVCPSLNSHPMRYTVFTLAGDRLSWKTPMVPLPESVHVQARDNLLADEWWRPTSLKARTAANDAAMLAFYENNEDVIGSITL